VKLRYRRLSFKILVLTTHRGFARLIVFALFPPKAIRMYVTRHSNITDHSVLQDLWHLYEVAYEPLAAADVTRETLYRSEFDALLADPTNRIWVVRDENRPVAMSLIATDIGSTRYLSRAYFSRVDPERSAAGLVHYVMWVVSHPDYQSGTAIFDLARGGLAVEADEGALLVFDLPESNQPNQEGRGAELLYRLAQMVAPVSLQEHGMSRYYALDFAPVATEDAAAPADGERVTA
jgi:hypothetical protein